MQDKSLRYASVFVYMSGKQDDEIVERSFNIGNKKWSKHTHMRKHLLSYVLFLNLRA